MGNPHKKKFPMGPLKSPKLGKFPISRNTGRNAKLRWYTRNLYAFEAVQCRAGSIPQIRES